MFEISQLKAKKLPELQEIAKQLNVPKYRTQKKLDLVYQILDYQAANPSAVKEKVAIETAVAPEAKETKPAPKRARVPQKPTESKEQKSLEFADKPEETKAKPQAQNKPNPRKPQERKPQENKPQDTKNKEEKSNTEKPVKEKAQPKPQEQKKPNPRKDDKRRPQNDRQPRSKDGNTHGNNSKSNGNKDSRNRYREPDFEFDAIIESEGVLDVMQDGYGFLRSSDYNYLSSPDDIYVSQSQIRLFGLKVGDTVLGNVRPPKEGEKYFPLIKVSKINGQLPNVVRDRVAFEHLTPLFPQEKFNIAEKQATISTRIMDLFAPIGKGQRGMIVSQPKRVKQCYLRMLPMLLQRIILRFIK
ncbi:Transcription termination factor Rho [Winogradskyella psychrotolerans RS-3]|uniref:Transcription termination factor Rho n=1 Tax=Winogradskyella psychrotolerans RS-3 TaxID=641526 RepID=S7VRB1_9FLAO|nr:Transcription termination factor Rho [Winogradskyella psychrotolerans RS-3]